MNLPVTRIHRKANFIPVTDLKLFDLSLERHEATCTNSQTRHFISLYSQRNLEVRLSMFIERPLIPLWFLIPRVGEKDRGTRLASSRDQVRWNWRNVEEKEENGSMVSCEATTRDRWRPNEMGWRKIWRKISIGFNLSVIIVLYRRCSRLLYLQTRRSSRSLWRGWLMNAPVRKGVSRVS